MSMGSFDNSHRIMYWLYYSLGGISGSDQISKRLRYLWLSWTILTFFIVDILGFFGYLLTSPRILIFDLIAVLWTTNATMYIIIFIPTVTYFNRRNLERAMTYIRNATFERDLQVEKFNDYLASIEARLDHGRTLFSNAGAPFGEQPLRHRHPLKSNLHWVAFELCSVLVYWGVEIINMFFSKSEQEYLSQQQHLFAVPYADRIPSFNLYLCIFAAETLIAVRIVVGAIAIPAFINIVVFELQNIAVDYCNRIRKISKTICGMTELIHANAITDRRIKKAFTVAVRHDLKVHIKHHQNFISAIKLIVPYVNLFNSLMLMTAYCCLIGSSYIIISTHIKNSFIVRQVSITVGALCFLYANCVAGQVLYNINELLINEVYNIPWYHLPVTSRLLVRVFLCQIQQPIRSHAFKIFPVNMTIFPRVMRHVYTFVNLLLRVISLHK